MYFKYIWVHNYNIFELYINKFLELIYNNFRFNHLFEFYNLFFFLKKKINLYILIIFIYIYFYIYKLFKIIFKFY